MLNRELEEWEHDFHLKKKKFSRSRSRVRKRVEEKQPTTKIEFDCIRRESSALRLASNLLYTFAYSRGPYVTLLDSPFLFEIRQNSRVHILVTSAIAVASVLLFFFYVIIFFFFYFRRLQHLTTTTVQQYE